jgi:hypothetical protein
MDGVVVRGQLDISMEEGRDGVGTQEIRKAMKQYCY